MSEFNTSLAREKIVIVEDIPSADSDGTIVIRSNRLSLMLGGKGKEESIVVRGHTMHGTLRMGAKIVDLRRRTGMLLRREEPVDWMSLWQQTVSTYERDHNKDNWIAIYTKGSPIFTTKPMRYIDIIEKCDTINHDNYEGSIEVAANALKGLGRPVKIELSSKLAVIISTVEKAVRCGIIQRTGKKDTTFNFTASGGATVLSTAIRSMDSCAAFLEAMNLGYMIADVREKVREKEIDTASPEAQKMREASRRLSALSREIDKFEEVFSVKYRPERPNFFKNT